MKSNTDVNDAAQLRLRAEEMARKKAAQWTEDQVPLSPAETIRTLHELRVHQIELEMQNEELRRAQQELDASRARYFDLYDLAPVGYCSVNERGLILEANLTAARLLGLARGAMTGTQITRYIRKEHSDGGAYQPWTFGYQGRNAAGPRSLANLYDTSVEYRMRPNVTLSGYYGFASGRAITQAIYPKGKNGGLGYAEVSYRF